MVLQQAIVLMIVGISIVTAFLGLLVVVMTVCGRIVPRFNHLLPDDPVRTGAVARDRPASAGAAGDVVAVAIAVAVARQRDRG